MQDDRRDPLDTPREHSQATENENLKAGASPRPATEPAGAEGSSSTTKTRTDPTTGAPTAGRPDTTGG